MLGRALVIVALGAAIARADVTTTVKGATVDWSTGEIVAKGIGPADRHAPAPAVARDAARVRAEDAARAILLAAAKALPGAKGTADDALAPIVARAITRTMDLGTDGSVTLQLAIPIEAVRVAGAGARAAAPSADPPPPVVIVDAAKLGVKPQVGLVIGGWTGPTVFVEAAPPDGSLLAGDHPRRVAATKAKGNTISIDGDPPASGALTVVVIGGKT
jgi:hypothetical protein